MGGSELPLKNKTDSSWAAWRGCDPQTGKTRWPLSLRACGPGPGTASRLRQREETGGKVGACPSQHRDDAQGRLWALVLESRH